MCSARLTPDLLSRSPLLSISVLTLLLCVVSRCLFLMVLSITMAALYVKSHQPAAVRAAAAAAEEFEYLTRPFQHAVLVWGRLLQ